MAEHRVESDRLAGLHRPKQRHLQENPLGSGVAQAPFRVRKDLEHPGEGVGVGHPGMFADEHEFLVADLQQRAVALGNLEQQRVPEVGQQIAQQSPEVLAGARELVEETQRRRGVARQQRPGEFPQLRPGRETEHAQHVAFGHLVAAKTDQLVEGRLRVAHAAVRAPGDGIQRGFVDLHPFGGGDASQLADDERGRDPAQVEALAAREDRGEDPLGIGGGEEELHVRRRFLEGLQQRVESRDREHVDFVDDVDFELRRGRREFHRVPQFADLLDAIVAGAVDLQDIQRTPLGDLSHPGIVVREIRARAPGTVEALGEDAGERGLPGAARPAEKVGVRDPVRRDGVGQRGRDVLLADDVGKALRPVFSGDDLVGHGRNGRTLAWRWMQCQRPVQKPPGRGCLPGMGRGVRRDDSKGLPPDAPYRGRSRRKQTSGASAGAGSETKTKTNPAAEKKGGSARAPTADAEQATVAAFLPWRGSQVCIPWTLARAVDGGCPASASPDFPGETF